MATATIPTDTPRRAVLRYFGGKWAIAPWVIQHLPAHRIYVEPFGGGASILLRKPRSRIEVYNDLDDEVVGIFRAVQNPDTCRQLIRRLHRTPYSRVEFEQAFRASADPVERSARAIIRSFMSFHHVSLFGVKTVFANARHRSRAGSSKAREWATYPRSLATICRRLRGVIIEQRDAQEVIRVQDAPDTLFFVDPPYLPQTRSKSGGYRHELTEGQHVELLERLLAVQGRVVLAGYPSDLYDRMLTGWHRVERRHRASGSLNSRTEVLWINPG